MIIASANSSCLGNDKLVLNILLSITADKPGKIREALCEYVHNTTITGSGQQSSSPTSGEKA